MMAYTEPTSLFILPLHTDQKAHAMSQNFRRLFHIQTEALKGGRRGWDKMLYNRRWRWLQNFCADLSIHFSP